MANLLTNLLQSAQTKTTCAPSFYTNYLSNLASAGQAAQAGAQYIGAQPLQTQAFQAAACGAGSYQPMISQGAGLLGCASRQNVAGAVTPYLQAATNASPLCAASPYLNAAAGVNLGGLAQCYMNPYIGSQIQTMSDIGQRNIMQNLAPQATAATVGSGQFGSQRGAQALGQVEAQAEQCLNANIANLLGSGYTTAMNAAIAKQGALGQAAGTAETAQAAQNQAQLQAAQEAANSTAQQAAVQQAAGLGLGTLGTQAQNIRLGCLNALATLGGQQQTIAQNQQLFPLTTLSNLASLLQGYSIPVGTKTTMCMSPLSSLMSLGAAAAGIKNNPVLSGALGSAYSGLQNALGLGSSGCNITSANPFGLPCTLNATTNGSDLASAATNLGATSSQGVGDIINSSANTAGSLDASTLNALNQSAICPTTGVSLGSLANIFFAKGGKVGCQSTKKHGALPGKE